MSVQREPAIRRTTHPAADLPERPTPTPAPLSAPQTNQPAARGEERLTEQHNVRLRPSTKARLLRAVDKLRYETGDRTISIASITDSAIVEYLESRDC
ncbi:hypothetical protein DQ226_11645 [Dietzia maris]|jgi:hypothetical protein|uniref:Uncharacterized protein n=1 Tax=Dietzia maris TaxID=37915 RepID=A0A365P8Y2_9ACTN|nr:hypothetical protein [Dietzia sp. SLG510A3-30A2]MBB0995479.1 hypothetical protein [Dietzia sp. SLG510A3-40A3]MBB0997704.1 hypothetical protein [Dietzia maris]MBB1010685.1 hypothetical protein [Dietzia sp. SLG510A3-3B2-2]MBB1032493.1 hypothetical protein [Dietzia sp. SLG310A2-38A2]MBB1040511.1 hypothetical protein [Dietzia sp. Cai40]MBB1044141.1 hypothetical protein [Dietzia sp. DQ11-44]MBB1055531.1 hypothetical protein [Dietzia sp. B44]